MGTPASKSAKALEQASQHFWQYTAYSRNGRAAAADSLRVYRATIWDEAQRPCCITTTRGAPLVVMRRARPTRPL